MHCHILIYIFFFIPLCQLFMRNCQVIPIFRHKEGVLGLTNSCIF